MSADYEVYAVKYGETQRPTREFFIYPDPHDGPEPIFYYIWVIKGPDGAIVVDTGFTHERAAKRNRRLDRLPTEGLSALGVDPADVELVILTHLHYDHAGNIDKFPNAKFVIQDEEVRFATGRYVKYAPVQLPLEADDVTAFVRANYAGRARFVDGDAEVAPGIRVHLAPGHARGLQAVTVPTRRGTLVLASDAAHFFENVTLQNPHPIVVDLPRTLESYERLLALAPSPDHFIPGHDPAIMDLYPKLDGDPLTAMLHADPLGPSPLSG